MKKLIDFLNLQDIAFEENVSGARLCSFRVGGQVSAVARPRNIEQLRALLDFLKSNKIKSALLGRGSNVVISDIGFNGAIVLLSEFNKISVQGASVVAETGASMLSLAVTAQKNALSGLEFAHGIPGSVGGGVYMNAGAYGGEISQIMTSCRCYDQKSGSLIELDNADCGFSYRHSVFQDNKDLVILSATFDLSCGSSDDIRSKMDSLRASRLEKQPLEYPSAGSTFKRPVDNFAGKLIEDAGLKGFSIGGAQVSEKHAGFVINRGGATCEDIKNLVEHIKREVKDKFGVTLECEIEFI